jgi:leucyl aminopeptidase
MHDSVPLRIATRPSAKADRIVVGVFAGEEPRLPRADLEEAGAALRFGGRERETAEASLRGGRARLVLAGLGERSELQGPTLQKWLRSIVAQTRPQQVRRLAVVLPPHEETSGDAAALRVGLELVLGSYRFDRFRAKKSAATLRTVEIVPPDEELGAYRKGARDVAAIAGGVALTRDLANTPPNVATPAWMASQARRLARARGMRVEVLAKTELERRKMGGILAVGAGSATGPRLVRLRWGRRGPRVALVGKGVTFDTGGISIKPSQSMEEMKFDKCGACAVLGVAAAVVDLDLPIRLNAYLPFAENMPDAAAYRPSDIIRCYDGTTVEIINTDAEGRLILADALAWAAEDEPDYLLEMSTLTGASVVALGESAAALYCSDDAWAGALLLAAAESGERLWRMPLWPELVEQMKGTHADLKNSGGRWGGGNTAAAFLSRFVGDCRRWAHVDLAGPAYAKQGESGPEATGYGVATTVRWLRSLEQAP